MDISAYVVNGMGKKKNPQLNYIGLYVVAIEND